MTDVVAFWDIENCIIRKKLDPNNLPKIFRTSLSMGGFTNVSVKVYGASAASVDAQKILNSGMFESAKVLSKTKDAADMALMVGILKFILKTPPPANILLISSDSDFSYIMNKLRSYGYNTLLSCSQSASESLKGSANVIWTWNNFLDMSAPCDSRDKRNIVPTFSHIGTTNPVMGVFWDMVKCPCPIPILDTMGYVVESALTKVNGEGGSIEYCCFGDSLKLDGKDESFRAKLTSAGFHLTDISADTKDAKMKEFVTLLMWCFHHPGSRVLLITNDDNYRDCIVELKGLGFQILFVYVDPIDKKYVDEPTRRLLLVSPVVWSLSTFLKGGPPLPEKKLRQIRKPPPNKSKTKQKQKRKRE